MVKSVLGVNHQGLRDFLIQRVTAVMMAIYSIGLIFFFVAHPNLAYYEWHGLFNQTWIKAVTVLVMLGLFYHAWVGVWTILTDYVKCACLRFTLHTIVLLSLIFFFLETLFIFWSV